MKPYHLLFLAVSLLLAYSNTSFAETKSKSESDYVKFKKIVVNKKVHHKNMQLLFFQHAKKATVTADEKKPHCSVITLSGMDKGIVFVSDTPQHVTGRLSLQQFLETWTHDLKIYGTKPNVILHANTSVGQTNVQAVSDTAEFSNPVYDATKETLSYTACPIAAKMALHAKQLYNVSVFIDPFHPWPP